MRCSWAAVGGATRCGRRCGYVDVWRRGFQLKRSRTTGPLTHADTRVGTAHLSLLLSLPRTVVAKKLAKAWAALASFPGRFGREKRFSLPNRPGNEARAAPAKH